MPYIKQQRRDALTNTSGTPGPQNAGELNYVFTVIVLRYLKDVGFNYQHINDIVGALEGAKLELYRRAVGKYEDQKIIENGDVYP